MKHSPHRPSTPFLPPQFDRLPPAPLDKTRLGQLIDLISNISFIAPSPAGRGRGEGTKYKDVPGFCKSAVLEDIRHHGHILTPGCYVGTAEVEDDEPFAEKMKRLVAQLRDHQAEAAKFDAAIAKNLEELECWNTVKAG